MMIKAADAGNGGNNIIVTISDVSPAVDPTLTTFTITVTETDVYPNLSIANIVSQLGSSTVSGATLISATPGSAPGLVQVEAGSVDPNGFPDPVSGSLSGNPAALAVTDSSSPGLVFTLLAKKSGADGALTQIDISPNTSSPSTPGTPTFTLTASWSKTLLDATLSDLLTVVPAQLGYEITVSLPSSGAFSVPAAAKSTLSGGTAGSPASAILYTGI
jgi:hypothetical protein